MYLHPNSHQKQCQQLISMLTQQLRLILPPSNDLLLQTSLVSFLIFLIHTGLWTVGQPTMYIMILVVLLHSITHIIQIRSLYLMAPQYGKPKLALLLIQK